MGNTLRDSLNKLENVNEETLRFSSPYLIWDFSSLPNFMAWDTTDDIRKACLTDVFNVKNHILLNRSHAKISEDSAVSPYSIYRKTCKDPIMSRASGYFSRIVFGSGKNLNKI